MSGGRVDDAEAGHDQGVAARRSSSSARRTSSSTAPSRLRMFAAWREQAIIQPAAPARWSLRTAQAEDAGRSRTTAGRDPGTAIRPSTQLFRCALRGLVQLRATVDHARRLCRTFGRLAGICPARAHQNIRSGATEWAFAASSKRIIDDDSARGQGLARRLQWHSPRSCAGRASAGLAKSSRAARRGVCMCRARRPLDMGCRIARPARRPRCRSPLCNTERITRRCFRRSDPRVGGGRPGSARASSTQLGGAGKPDLLCLRRDAEGTAAADHDVTSRRAGGQRSRSKCECRRVRIPRSPPFFNSAPRYGAVSARV